MKRFNFQNLIWNIKRLPRIVPELFVGVVNYFRLVLLLFFVFGYYLLNRHAVDKLVEKPKHKSFFLTDLIGRGYSKVYRVVICLLDYSKPQQMKSSDLMLLAVKNLTTKRARSLVTMGGMAIGFGAVILLLSTGYGFERLVVSQVANLSEMKQIDVNISNGSPLVFGPEAVETIQKIEGVESVIPIITSVSKVTYNDAVSDVIVYAVPTVYFESVSIRPVAGELYSDNIKKIHGEVLDEEKGEVAGVHTTLIAKSSIGSEVYKIRYAINPLEWKPVYKSPDIQSQIIGYTKREPGKQEAVEVWGSAYADGSESALDLEGNVYNTWISDDFSLWDMESCLLKDPACADGLYSVQRDEETQLVRIGYITEDFVAVERYQITVGSSYEIYDGKLIDSVSFSVDPHETIAGYFDMSSDGPKTNIVFGEQVDGYAGQLHLGFCDEPTGTYCIASTEGTYYGYWIQVHLDVWGRPECETVCESYSFNKTEENTQEVSLRLYLKAMDVTLPESVQKKFFDQEAVLGSETEASDENLIDLNTLIGSDDTTDWAALSSELGTTQDIEKDVKAFPKNAMKQALVNTAMLRMLGLETADAVGEKFDATLIFDSKLFNKTNYTVESESGTFTIQGIVSDSSTPTFYVPFSDVLVDGLENVSTIKVVTSDSEAVLDVRKSLEALGFQTSSVVDTVASVNSFFGDLRLVLLILGLIALGVASLGMFNTLTVSLLEKTREVGLLKTMGLKSTEVSTLFLAESMIMSVMGGFLGLLFGFLAGKVISLLFSVFSISQGRGFLSVTYIPFLLGFGTVALSSVVGVVTGWYPANRAKKISALNAMRYE